jgi:hypothetical protein
VSTGRSIHALPSITPLPREGIEVVPSAAADFAAGRIDRAELLKKITR